MVSAPYERQNEKTIKMPFVPSGLYLEINIADLRKVFACTVTYIQLCEYLGSEAGGVASPNQE